MTVFQLKGWNDQSLKSNNYRTIYFRWCYCLRAPFVCGRSWVVAEPKTIKLIFIVYALSTQYSEVPEQSMQHWDECVNDCCLMSSDSFPSHLDDDDDYDGDVRFVLDQHP